MARKDISDLQVLQAYVDAQALRDAGQKVYPEHLLMERTGQCEKVCYRAMERAFDRKLIDYGLWLRGGWVEDKGKAMLEGAK